MTSGKLNIGCGRSPREGWINLDMASLPGVDLVFDLEHCPRPFQIGGDSLPLPDNSIVEMEMSHVIEHITNVLPMMQELYRVAKPGCLLTVRCPYGSSDDADEDPTHVRRMFIGSWIYFSQPAYWRADYGYRGDWDLKGITLRLSRKKVDLTMSAQQVMRMVANERNVVTEMIAQLTAVKPLRVPMKDLQKPPRIDLSIE